MKGEISIIIPVYNAEKYLRTCLDSVLSQTKPLSLIILVNDGSTDSSLEICKEYVNLYKNIELIDKKNGGVSSARNAGLEVVKTELIAFADSDDVLDSTLIETLYSAMKENNVDRSLGGYYHLFENGKKVYRKPRIPDGLYQTKDLLPVMIDDGTMSGFLFSGVYNSLYKKSIIEKAHIRFSEEIKYNEDGLFNFEYALHSVSFYSLRSKPLYYYRQSLESATARRKPGEKYQALKASLRSLCISRDYIDIETQLLRRNVTEALWEILDITRCEKLIVGIKQIKTLLKSKEVSTGFEMINPSKLNRYKRVYYYLMRYQCSVILYLLTKWLFPILLKVKER